MVSVQDVFDRAIAHSTANVSGFYSGKEKEILARVNYGQQRLFTKLAQENRYFYVQATTIDSNNAPSAREVDLATKTPLVERLLMAKLPSGTELSQVDLQDLDAELKPRFYPLGTKMIEVANDWGATGVVTLSIWYAYRPAELDLVGALTQNVTVPDRFCEYLELDLAAYFAGADFGRAESSPSEIKRLRDEQGAVYQDFLQHTDHFAGPSSRRFVLPTPTPSEKA
jgi:hypothetical protein